jgi:hypothetical protein
MKSILNVGKNNTIIGYPFTFEAFVWISEEIGVVFKPEQGFAKWMKGLHYLLPFSGNVRMIIVCVKKIPIGIIKWVAAYHSFLYTTTIVA